MRLADYVIPLGDSDRAFHADLKDFVKRWGALGANAVLVHLEEESYYRSFVERRGFRRMLTRFRWAAGQARAAGWKVVVYLNGMEVISRRAGPRRCGGRLSRSSMYRVHPGWVMRDIHGAPLVFRCNGDEDYYARADEDMWVSPFSPYRKLLVARMGQLARAGADAVWIDVMHLPGNFDRPYPNYGCYERTCRRAFRRSASADPPRRVDWSSPRWRRWMRFRIGIVRDYAAGLAAKAGRLGLVPMYETSAIDTAGATLMANDPARMANLSLGFVPEIDPPDDRGRGLLKAKVADWRDFATMALFARDILPHKPHWPLTYFCGRGDAGIELGLAVATSSSYYPVDICGDDRRAESLAARGLGFFRKNEAELDPGFRTPAATVGLAYSATARDRLDRGRFNQYGSRGTVFQRSYRSAAARLLATHVPFRILNLSHLPARSRIEELRTVVLPAGVSLTAAERRLLAGKRLLRLRRRERLDTSNLERSVSPVRNIDAPSTTLVFPYHTAAGGLQLILVNLVFPAPVTIELNRLHRTTRITPDGTRITSTAAVLELTGKEPFEMISLAP